MNRTEIQESGMYIVTVKFVDGGERRFGYYQKNSADRCVERWTGRSGVARVKLQRLVKV